MVIIRQPRPLGQSRSTRTAEHAEAMPAQQQIRERAYRIYEARQGAHGCPEMDWLEAERSLCEAEQSPPQTGTPAR